MNSTKDVPRVAPKPEPVIVKTENVPAVIVVGAKLVKAAGAATAKLAGIKKAL